MRLRVSLRKLEFLFVSQRIIGLPGASPGFFVLWDHGFHCGTLKLLEGH